MLSTVAELPLRAICSEAAAAAIARHPWEDVSSFIRGRVGAWRACFPRARAALLLGRSLCTFRCSDAAFAHLRGNVKLSMLKCGYESTAAARRQVPHVVPHVHVTTCLW
jgi:hypothetical protein